MQVIAIVVVATAMAMITVPLARMMDEALVARVENADPPCSSWPLWDWRPTFPCVKTHWQIPYRGRVCVGENQMACNIATEPEGLQ